MSGYLEAHGDTMTVDLVVSNERELHADRQRIIHTNVWWNGSEWVDIDNAARAYHQLVRALNRNSYPDLHGVDLLKVDFHGLVRKELAEANLIAGRDALAGLSL